MTESTNQPDTPRLFPTVTAQTQNYGPVVVPCEPVSEDIVVIPDFGMDEQFNARMSGGFVVTHRPTGTCMTDSAGCIYCARRAARAFAESGIDWSASPEVVGEAVAALSVEARRGLSDARALGWSCEADLCEPAEDTRQEATR